MFSLLLRLVVGLLKGVGLVLLLCLLTFPFGPLLLAVTFLRLVSGAGKGRGAG